MHVECDWEVVQYNSMKDPKYVLDKYDNCELVLTIPKSRISRIPFDVLFRNNTIFSDNSLRQIDALYNNYNCVLNQLYLDFHRQNITLHSTHMDVETLIHYVEYNVKSKLDSKRVLTCCTQAIMAIALLCIYAYFNLDSYVICEIGNDVNYDKALYADICINKGIWNVHIQKSMRIVDIPSNSTMYYILIDINIDEEGCIVTLKSFI